MKKILVVLSVSILSMNLWASDLSSTKSEADVLQQLDENQQNLAELTDKFNELVKKIEMQKTMNEELIVSAGLVCVKGNFGNADWSIAKLNGILLSRDNIEMSCISGKSFSDTRITIPRSHVLSFSEMDINDKVPSACVLVNYRLDKQTEKLQSSCGSRK
ncbi:MAG: hypothetical protein HOO06_16505 [Bdellovibrionaceae bacterium]|jgi:hypothetical protein|nr:hypothetical protein [Pseudobdellovibrionaceae bacterium]